MPRSPLDDLRSAAAGSHNALNRAWLRSWSVAEEDLNAFIRSTEEALRKARALRLVILGRAALAAEEHHGAAPAAGDDR